MLRQPLTVETTKRGPWFDVGSVKEYTHPNVALMKYGVPLQCLVRTTRRADNWSPQPLEMVVVDAPSDDCLAQCLPANHAADDIADSKYGKCFATGKFPAPSHHIVKFHGKKLCQASTPLAGSSGTQAQNESNLDVCGTNFFLERSQC